MSRLLRPPENKLLTGEQIVFLAGPIQGAPDWQSELGNSLLTSDSNIYVASPRRENDDRSSFCI